MCVAGLAGGAAGWLCVCGWLCCVCVDIFFSKMSRYFFQQVVNVNIRKVLLLLLLEKKKVYIFLFCLLLQDLVCLFRVSFYWNESKTVIDGAVKKVHWS